MVLLNGRERKPDTNETLHKQKDKDNGDFHDDGPEQAHHDQGVLRVERRQEGFHGRVEGAVPRRQDVARRRGREEHPAVARKPRGQAHKG